MTTPVSRVRVEGPLAPYSEGFRVVLLEHGYTPLSAANVLRVMAHVSRWLRKRNVGPRDLTPARIAHFLRARRRAGYTQWLSARGVAPLLAYLRQRRLVPALKAARAQTGDERLVCRYSKYLRRERGLANATIHHRQRNARCFLGWMSSAGGVGLRRLRPADVGKFLLRETRQRSVRDAGKLASDLRCFLRFLHVDGRTRGALAGAVPAMAGWKLASLPRALPSGHVQQLLGSCARRTACGQRDYAILVLLARLGLRACEVVALRLEDIDWRRGVLLVRGKGVRLDELPLPVDVGKALAAYLEGARPRSTSRAVFLRGRAPEGPLRAGAITDAVYRACMRAGGARVGAHRLRHTAATQMLRQGSSLAEIAQVLRHKSLLTTALYAKVDRASLRSLAQPWPQGGAA